MEEPVIECVPNFSEGRDAATVQALADAVRKSEAMLLDASADVDHHRAVLTLVGGPRQVLRAVEAATAVALERIDLHRHQGVHPRIGALDVLPFVPLQGCTLNDCAHLAHEAGERLWERFGLPCYFYGAAALHPSRERLEEIRRGGWETLRAESQNGAERRPDVGGPGLHPTAGAVAIGARKPLVAFNIELTTNDVTIAQFLAKQIRTSSGGFAHVKALGLFLEATGRAQVSINFTDYERTSVHQVVERVREYAAALSVSIHRTELIGLIPQRSLEQATAYYWQNDALAEGRVLEQKVATYERLREARAWVEAARQAPGNEFIAGQAQIAIGRVDDPAENARLQDQFAEATLACAPLE